MVSLQDIATINPKSGPLQNTFIYIDLEAVEKGELRKIQEIMREEAPSRAQRVTMIFCFNVCAPIRKTTIFIGF